MVSRIAGILAILLVKSFLSIPPVEAEEIVLTYTQDDWDPSAIRGWNVAERGEPDWAPGKRGLTPKAHVFYLNGKLAAIDADDDSATYPNTFHLDVNGDKERDEGESFPLNLAYSAWLKQANSPGNPYRVEKIPLLNPVNGGAGYTLANLVLMELNGQILYSLSPWGCMKGTGRVASQVCTFTLRDDNKNGLFGDRKDTMKSQFDTLTLAVDGEEERSPLQRKLIFLNNAYSIDVIDNGTALILEPLETEFGLANVPEKGMEVVLFNSDWGLFPIRHGSDQRLPVGTYCIASFSRTQSQPLSRCFYEGPAELEIDVEAGKNAAVSLETLFIATVTKMRSSSRIIRLGVKLTTSQGAVFSGYSGTMRAQGLPFCITDSRGKIVVNDSFEFG